MQRRTHRQRADSDVGSGTATRLNRVTRVAYARYVSGCPEKEDPAVDVNALWKISVDTIGALTLLSMGDFFVEVKKPSENATEGLYQTLSLSAKAIENLTKGDMMWPDGEMKLLSDQVLDSVDVAEACGGHGNLEPRFTDAPWKMALFTQAITQTRKIGVVLAAMEWSVSEGNSKEWSSEFCQHGRVLAIRAKRRCGSEQQSCLSRGGVRAFERIIHPVFNRHCTVAPLVLRLVRHT